MPPRNRGFAKPKNAKKTIGRILSYMGRFKSLWLLVFVCTLLASLASVAGSYMIKPAIDNFIVPMAKDFAQAVQSGLGTQAAFTTIAPAMLNFAKLALVVLGIFLLGTLASWSNSRIMI